MRGQKEETREDRRKRVSRIDRQIGDFLKFGMQEPMFVGGRLLHRKPLQQPA